MRERSIGLEGHGQIEGVTPFIAIPSGAASYCEMILSHT